MNGRLSRVLSGGVVTLVYLFLWLPILVILVVSFDTSPFLRFPPQGYSLEAYATVFRTPEFTRGFVVSLVVAALSTVVVLAISVSAALAFVRHRFRGGAAAQGFFLSPLLVPNIVLGLALLLLFAPLGLTDGIPGLVLAHVVLSVPYAIRTITVALSTADAACEDAARVHGASAIRTFWRVTLPLIRPGVIAGGTLAFLVSFDEAVVSLFLSGFNVTPLPVALLEYMETRAGPEVAALSVILILFSVTIVMVIERVLGLTRTLRS